MKFYKTDRGPTRSILFNYITPEYSRKYLDYVVKCIVIGTNSKHFKLGYKSNWLKSELNEIKIKNISAKNKLKILKYI